MLINEDFFDDIEGKDIEVDSTETHSKPENYWSITLEFFSDCNPSDFIKQRGKYKEYMSSLGNGGLCLNCEVCTFPNCGFAKGGH